MGERANHAGQYLAKGGATVDKQLQPQSGMLTIIVPVYNEGENFRAWWAAAAPLVSQHGPGWLVRVVYDFEEDNTLPVVRELAAKGAPVEALRNRSRGVLQALITGLQSVSSGPAVVSMADLSDDLTLLPKMLAAYKQGAAVVVASRYMPGGKQLGGPRLKGFLSRLGGLSLKYLAGFPVADATNNFRLYDAALVNEFAIESQGGFEIAFELTYKAWKAGANIVELPCTWQDRVQGQSRFRLGKWLPLYVHWYLKALFYGIGKRVGLVRARSGKP